MPRTGTSKDLFERDVPLILRHQHYMKLSKLFLVPMYALSVFRLPLHRGKKQNTPLRRLGMNLRKEIRPKKRGVTRELSKKCLAKPEMPLILGRSGTQYVAMVTKLLN